MKYLVWIIALLNLYQGFNFGLNFLGILQDSKYAQSSNAIFSILLLSMSLGGLYLSYFKDNQKMALLVTLGPWVLILIILLFSMLFSDYK